MALAPGASTPRRRRGTESGGLAAAALLAQCSSPASTPPSDAGAARLLDGTTEIADSGGTDSTSSPPVDDSAPGTEASPSGLDASPSVDVDSSLAAYPVKVGPTGRYLVDQNGRPFLLAGDAPQSLIVNLSEADADFYFADRQAHGFNTAWINLPKGILSAPRAALQSRRTRGCI